jgi:hypothetical protein
MMEAASWRRILISPYLRKQPRELSEVLAKREDTPARAELRRQLKASEAADIITDKMLAELRYLVRTPGMIAIIDKPVLGTLIDAFVTLHGRDGR